MPSPITHPAYSRLVIAACADALALFDEDTITEHPPVPPGRDLGSEVRRALDGSRLRAGGGILPPRPALSANRPSPHSLKTPDEAYDLAVDNDLERRCCRCSR